jgi:hypothetical protein
MGDECYERIELTEDELKAAILEGKKRKFFKERADEKEKEDGVHQLRESKDRKQRPHVMRHVRGSIEESGKDESTGTQSASIEGVNVDAKEVEQVRSEESKVDQG